MGLDDEEDDEPDPGELKAELLEEDEEPDPGDMRAELLEEEEDELEMSEDELDEAISASLASPSSRSSSSSLESWTGAAGNPLPSSYISFSSTFFKRI